MVELLSGLLMGLTFAGLGAVVGFTRPTDAEAAADPQTLRWGRRPAVRRRVGILIIVIGVLIAVLHVVSAMMK